MSCEAQDKLSVSQNSFLHHFLDEKTDPQLNDMAHSHNQVEAMQSTYNSIPAHCLTVTN